jgi:hypothetical protein
LNLTCFFKFQICINCHTGDVFVVIAPPDNVENIDYYLLRCTTIKCKLLDSEIDSDGQDFERGSVILKGKYFKQVDNNRTGYMFEEYEPHNVVMQYNHHVIATHFPLSLMKRRGNRCQRWKLGLHDHERLLEVLSFRVDPTM